MFDIWSMLYTFPVILIALTVHEFSHGYAAHLLGDPTPKQQGRLTLNPLPHLDPLGTLMMLVARFGWAKPVQVNPFYFKGNRQRGMLLVALAGPLSNVLVAFVGALLYNLLVTQARDLLVQHNYLSYFIRSLVSINIYLAVFNLIPVPPLDGSKILLGLMPRQYHESIYSLEAYGPILLMLLILTNITGRVLVPIARVVISCLDIITYLLVTAF